MVEMICKGFANNGITAERAYVMGVSHRVIQNCRPPNLKHKPNWFDGPTGPGTVCASIETIIRGAKLARKLASKRLGSQQV